MILKSILYKTGLLLTLLAGWASYCAEAQIVDSNKVYKVYVFDIKKEIAPPVLRIVRKAFDDIKENGTDLIIIDMNTYGGLLDAADSIRTAILHSPVPVHVLINNNAASAGALIAIACDSIYMTPGASIGAATVVNQSGEVVPDKYQSYMRSMMRSTAEAKGRDPMIAQAMVDPKLYVPGVSDSGQVLTFTASEAIKNNFCEGMAGSVDDVLQELGIEKYEIVEQKLTAMDKVIGFLVNPIISGLLIMVIIMGIYFELQSPGIGFPLGAAVTAALLYFAPLYLEGLAENWEILIFIAGIILLAVEIFAIPGFGVAGVLGIILMIAGLTLSMVDNIGFEIKSFDLSNVVKAFFVVVIAGFTSLVLSFYLGKKMFTTHMFGHLALDTVQNVDEGYIGTDATLKTMIGQQGVATTVLRPAGKVEINADEYDATAISGYIEKGDRVEVVKYEAAQLFVRKVSQT